MKGQSNFSKTPDYGNKFPHSVQEDLKELLKRCPAGTYEAALAFRQDKDVSQIETIVMGVIDRHLEPEQREILVQKRRQPAHVRGFGHGFVDHA